MRTIIAIEPRPMPCSQPANVHLFDRRTSECLLCSIQRFDTLKVKYGNAHVWHHYGAVGTGIDPAG